MNDNKIVNLTKKLIAIPSISSNPKDLNDVLKISQNYLENEKLKFKFFEKNKIPSLLIYNTPKVAKKFKVILNAHLDVVPGKPDQYKAKILNNKLFGRGAYDMKASAAAEIEAFASVANKVSYPLALQLVTDEEVGGFNGTKYQIEEGVKTDFVIAGESTDFDINNEAKGILWIKVKAKGVAAHGARPWEGKNALQKINAFTNKINQALPTPTKPEWRTTQNLSRIETNNSTFNKVPEDALAMFDIRYIPDESKIIENKIRKLVPKDLELEVVFREPSQFTPAENSFIKLLNTSIKKVTNTKPRLVSYHGASDIRHYNSTSMPGVCFGPIGAGLHSDNEWVDIKSLEDYKNTLIDFLLNIKN